MQLIKCKKTGAVLKCGIADDLLGGVQDPG
jgi:hypothetical protein